MYRCWLWLSCCAISQTVYSRQVSLPGRRCPTLAQLAWRHRAGWFAVNLSVPTQTLSVATVLPRCWTVTVAQLCYCDTLSGPSGGSSYLGHCKNYWLIVDVFPVSVISVVVQRDCNSGQSCVQHLYTGVTYRWTQNHHFHYHLLNHCCQSCQIFWPQLDWQGWSVIVY